MKILYLPIDIDVSNIAIPEVDFKKSIGGRYQPFWNTFEINDSELKHIFDQLPFENITNIYFKEQKSIVGPHVDVNLNMRLQIGEYENILANEPSGYRIILEGGTDKLSVKTTNGFVPAIVPAVPGCYLLNSTQAVHTVSADPGRKIIYVRGFLNAEKHQTLIEKSYNKYAKFAVIEH